MRKNTGFACFTIISLYLYGMDNCKYCGKELIHTPGRRKKEFCDDNCRVSYWQKQQKLNQPIAPFHERVATQHKADTAPLAASMGPKSFQDYLREAPTTKNPIEFVRAVMADKSLTPAQRDQIRAKVKPEKIK
jgi:hypothetical protein